jgi:hypothetical protein
MDMAYFDVLHGRLSWREREKLQKKKKKISVSISGSRAEIWSRDFPDAKKEYYPIARDVQHVLSHYLPCLLTLHRQVSK